MSELFTETIRRYTFNSWVFIKLREKLKLSAKDFAEKIGWSFQYQYKLEAGKFETISEKTFNEINQVFSKYSILKIPHIFTGNIIESFVVDTKELKRQRIKKGITVKEFAISCGWSWWYQYQIERKNSATISQLAVKTIQKALQ